MNEPRISPVVRAASLAAIALLALLVVGFAGLVSRDGRETARVPASKARRVFHAADRQPVELPALRSNCARCHGGTPHFRRPEAAAFLNLHTAELDCAVCHLAAAGTRYARFGPDGRESENPIHAVHLARPGAQGPRPVTGPEGGALRRARPAACRECHQRGSELLRTPGLYPDYRRLLLEDLAVLRRGEVEG
jgi:cytochrome c553